MRAERAWMPATTCEVRAHSGTLVHAFRALRPCVGLPRLCVVNGVRRMRARAGDVAVVTWPGVAA
eukprot:7171123-Alexandrium_andersonii.AAC.1